MMGLIIVAGFCLYVYLLYLATSRAYLWSKSRGFSIYKNIGFGFLGFLAVYLPIFWDFLPMLVMKKYYCNKDGGVVVYQTAEQWAKANPERAKNVWFYEWRKSPISQDGSMVVIGNQFGVRRIYTSAVNGWVGRYEIQFVDVNTGSILHLSRGYSSTKGKGYPELEFGKFKFWMNSKGCGNEEEQEILLRDNFRKLGQENKSDKHKF